MSVKLVQPVMTAAEAQAAAVTLRAVVDGRLLVEHDEVRVALAAEALEHAPEATPNGALPGGARRSDPGTSKRAARNVAPRTGSLRAVVLDALGRRGAMCSGEIRYVTGKDGIWKRISELAGDGWIEKVGERVFADSKQEQIVYGLTEKGRRWFAAQSGRSAR